LENAATLRQLKQTIQSGNYVWTTALQQILVGRTATEVYNTPGPPDMTLLSGRDWVYRSIAADPIS